MPPFKFRYRGDVRTVTPGTCVFHYGSRDSSVPQWWMTAFDEEARGIVYFALPDITELGTAG